MQGLQTIHQGRTTASGQGNDIICDRKRTKKYQRQRPLPHTHNHPPPHNTKIENAQQSRKTLEAVDEELIRILNVVKESEYTYEKEQEAARQQARATRPLHRTEYNFTSLNSSTPIKNMGTTENRHQPPERTTHFNPNLTHHFYPQPN